MSTLKTDSLGNSNLDITKDDELAAVETQEEESSSFSFELNHYEINNSKLLFQNDVSKMILEKQKQLTS